MNDPLPTLVLMRHINTGDRILLISKVGADGAMEVLHETGSQFELSAEQLEREYEPVVSVGQGKVEAHLSDRAYRVLWLIAAHVADVGPNGMSPTELGTLERVAGLSASQIVPTINRLLGLGLICQWDSSALNLRVAPTVLGYLRLGSDAPTTSQMRAGRTS